MESTFRDRLMKVVENLKSTKVTERKKAKEAMMDMITKKPQYLTRFRK